VKALRNMLLLILAMQLSLGQISGQIAGDVQPVRASESPAALVRTLYAQVVSLQPLGVTKWFDMTTFAPFLSKDLRHRIDQTAACEADFFRQYPQTDMKPSFGWLELGLFTGGGGKCWAERFSNQRNATTEGRDCSSLCDAYTCRVRRAPLDVAGCSYRAA
jgi:hypothetical protein